VDALNCYREVWAVDFEFHSPAGSRPVPLCVSARELRTGREAGLWLADGAAALPPYPTGPGVLFMAYYASAELGCHLALGWPMPARILDLFAEFRNLTNGRPVTCGAGLLGALAYFGLDGLAATEKKDMQALAIRGGPFDPSEKAALMTYCRADVDALIQLLPAMLPTLDLPRALLRGRYMAAAARMEWAGVPLDPEAFAALRDGWDKIKGRLVREVDKDYGVFVPAGRPPLDPETKFGSAVIEAARLWGLNPDALAAAADHVHREERSCLAGRREAVRAARKATGITVRQANDLEDRYPVGFDADARDLAGMYPDLGIGRGYDPDVPDLDYGERLWHVLTEPDPLIPPRHSAETIRKAADMLGPDAGREPPVGPMTFSSARFGDYLARFGIPWPRRPDEALALDDETFREMAKAYPRELGPIRELRHTLSKLRLNELAVGPDGRNRTLLSAFRSTTGRNQPSNSKYVFGPSTWLRSLIRPGPGRALAYVDWSQQELGIAAALSEDPQMMEAYRSGDFYLTFAKMAGAVPADATKATHGRKRDQFKTLALGVLFGLSADGLARKLGEPPCRGRELLDLHRRTFRRFWQWSDTVETAGMLSGELRTAFGWTLHVGPDVNPRSLRNFPMQANGAEMMRLAACLATERGLCVCAPVHDAFLIEAAADRIEADTAAMQAAMREASELVLPGFPLKTDAKIVRYPDRYADPRGERLWAVVDGLLADLAAEVDPCHGWQRTPATGDTPALSYVSVSSPLEGGGEAEADG
jgi:hypothetical protein